MKRKMISDGKFTHEGKALNSGDEFEADEQEAADLASRPIRLAHYKTEDSSNGAKRQYRRRDMTAEK